MYDYFLNGKDNISQVVSCCPDCDRIAPIQARHVHFTNTDAIAVRGLSYTSMG
jgi:hypothetical protein